MSFFNSFLWLSVTVFIILIGFYLSFKLNGIQFKFLKMVKSIFSKNGDISCFSLLMTSLAGRIGVGSIAGVSLSIYIGGVGSIFWMWVSTFFCAIITYSECVLGVKYKVSKNGSFYGGPSYYIKKGLGNNFLGNIYAILIIISYIGCFLAIQSNTITKSLVSTYSLSPYIIAIGIVVVTFFCIYGGLKRIIDVSFKLVPIMSFIYIGSAVIVFTKNFNMLGSIVGDIFISAFNFKSFFGGFLPMVIIGIERGIFSNEAGIGTSSIIASSSYSCDYVKQGISQMFGVYITTFLICTATAFILLTSDFSSLSYADLNGIELAGYAFKYHFGNVGIYILNISIVLFSFSTIVTGYYYGECGFNYFFSKIRLKYIYILRFITLFILFIGSLLSSTFLWNIVDILVGILVLINLYSIWNLKDKID